MGENIDEVEILKHAARVPPRSAAEKNADVPSYWACFEWWKLIRPRYVLWLVFIGISAVLAGGLAGIVLGAQSDCESQNAQALNEFGYVVDKFQEQVSIRTLPVISIGAFVRQTPYLPDMLEKFDSIAADLMGHESAVRNLQLAPSGVVTAIYPLEGHESAIGHDLFRDPNRRPDSFKTTLGAPSVTLSNPVRLTLEGEKGNAVFARYPIFIDGPVENRTEAFGAPEDAYECNDVCYGNPEQVYWGMSTALVDFDVLLEATGLTALEDKGACFALRTSSTGSGTDLLSDNTTIYSSTCTAKSTQIIRVLVPNGEWFLEIGYAESCSPWVAPVAVILTLAMLGVLLLALTSLYQSVKNTVLAELGYKAELGHLIERQKQVARDEAAAGSDVVRRLIVQFSRLTQSYVSGSAKHFNSLTSLNMSFAMMPQHSSNFIVTSIIWNLSEAKISNPKACTAMLEVFQAIYLEVTSECRGECQAAHEGSGVYVTRFQEVSNAVLFSRKLRRAAMTAAWPAEVLALPGCQPQSLAVTFQQAKGPQLKTLIDWDMPETTKTERTELCEAALPRQILMTGDVWSQLISNSTMAAADFPDVRALGTLSHPNVQQAKVLLEVNEPKWDMRLPQVPRVALSKAFSQITPPPEGGIWSRPDPSVYGTDQASSRGSSIGCTTDALVYLPLVALELAPPPHEKLLMVSAEERHQQPQLSAAAKERLQGAVESMCLIYGGHVATRGSSLCPGVGQPVVIAFPSPDNAMAFCASLQQMLVYAEWDQEDLERWGPRELGPLGKLLFAGPRIKAALDLEHQRSFRSVPKPTDKDMAQWTVSRLLEVTHGGQTLMTARVCENSTITESADELRIYDLGVHCLSSKDEASVELKEIQLVDLKRSFPPPPSIKEVSPGYSSSPDPSSTCAFVYCQVSCPGGSKVSSRTSFIQAINSWKAIVAELSAKHGGYEIINKGTGLAMVFRSLEAALVFATTMHKAMTEMDVAADLLQADGFQVVRGPQQEVLFRGPRAKVGVSFGIPAMRSPNRTTGRASYFGTVVQTGARLMMAACPGQTLVDGQALISRLGVPSEAFDASAVDAQKEPATLSNHKLSRLGCARILARPLGYFKIEDSSSDLPLADVWIPELSGRVFSAPPGRTDGGASVDPENKSIKKVVLQGGEKRSSTHNLATMLSDILEDRIAERTPGSEEKVRITGVLGEGMQGKVMQGKWKGVDVAYKLVRLPYSTSKQNKAETRALLEMAISATMAHPNVVQTYSYEMVFLENNSAADFKSNLGGSGIDEDAAMSAEMLKSGSAAIDRDGAEFFSESPATGSTTMKRSGGYYEARLIQELCNLKTIRDNLDSSALTKPGDTLPDVSLMLVLAHDIACGMQHVHSQNIIHGDLKASNVLLASASRFDSLWAMSGLRGSPLPVAIAKVADFGLSARLTTDQTHLSNVLSGTITHMAPEILLAGHLSKSADVFAFGILMWEMFTGQRAFDGMNMQQVVHAVGSQNRRPVFPPGVPVNVIKLACKCWGPAAQRPSFEEITQELSDLLQDRRTVIRGQVGSASSFSGLQTPAAVDVKWPASSDRPAKTNIGNNSQPSPTSDGDEQPVDFKALQMQGSNKDSTSLSRLSKQENKSTSEHSMIDFRALQQQGGSKDLRSNEIER